MKQDYRAPFQALPNIFRSFCFGCFYFSLINETIKLLYNKDNNNTYHARQTCVRPSIEGIQSIRIFYICTMVQSEPDANEIVTDKLLKY